MANAPEPNPPKVFISYAWKNQPVAKQLQRDLIRDGVEVFVDYEKISGGDSLPERISAALEWCNTLVLLWSTDAAHSYYVSQEWTSAFHLQKRIIACVLDDAPLPALLRGRLWLNFSPYEIGYPQLCRSLGVEPKIAKPTPAPPSTLPPQHVEFPLPEPKPPPAEPGKTLPPTKPVSEKSAPKPKRRQPPVSKTTVIPPSGPAPARRISFRWPRSKVMNFTFVVILVAVAVAVFKMCQQSPPTSIKKEPAARKSVLLRSTGKTLSEDSVKAMLVRYGFYDGIKNEVGKGITHQYKSKKSWIIFGDAVVIDYATGLMWQQSGSRDYMVFADAEKYVRGLNNDGFAGYADWRLPTLEEAMSLMEPEKKNGDLYIDPKFDRTQRWIWTADKESAGVAWVVYFANGRCDHFNVDSSTYVRAVRGGQ